MRNDPFVPCVHTIGKYNIRRLPNFRFSLCFIHSQLRAYLNVENKFFFPPSRKYIFFSKQGKIESYHPKNPYNEMRKLASWRVCFDVITSMHVGKEIAKWIRLDTNWMHKYDCTFETFLLCTLNENLPDAQKKQTGICTACYEDASSYWGFLQRVTGTAITEFVHTNNH